MGIKKLDIEQVKKIQKENKTEIYKISLSAGSKGQWYIRILNCVPPVIYPLSQKAIKHLHL